MHVATWGLLGGCSLGGPRTARRVLLTVSGVRLRLRLRPPPPGGCGCAICRPPTTSGPAKLLPAAPATDLTSEDVCIVLGHIMIAKAL